MKRIVACMCALGLLLGSAGAAKAEQIGIVTIQGLASGTLDGVPFTNAHVVFTGVYDPGKVASGKAFLLPPFITYYAIAPLQEAFVEVEGMGKAQVLQGGGVNHFVNDPIPFGGAPAALEFTWAGFHLEAGFASRDFTYDLTRSLSSQPAYARFPYSPPTSLSTSAGPLKLSPINPPPWFVKVDVFPEPSALALLAIGAAGLLVYGLRRRCRRGG
jgi:hypothetical protein